MNTKPPKTPKHTPLLTSDLMRDLRIRLDALITRGCTLTDRNDPVSTSEKLDLYELSARLDLLIETLDSRRRIHTSVYTPHEDDLSDG